MFAACAINHRLPKPGDVASRAPVRLTGFRAASGRSHARRPGEASQAYAAALRHRRMDMAGFWCDLTLVDLLEKETAFPLTLRKVTDLLLPRGRATQSAPCRV